MLTSSTNRVAVVGHIETDDESSETDEVGIGNSVDDNADAAVVVVAVVGDTGSNPNDGFGTDFAICPHGAKGDGEGG